MTKVKPLTDQLFLMFNPRSALSGYQIGFTISNWNGRGYMLGLQIMNIQIN